MPYIGELIECSLLVKLVDDLEELQIQLNGQFRLALSQLRNQTFAQFKYLLKCFRFTFRVSCLNLPSKHKELEQC